MIVRAIL